MAEKQFAPFIIPLYNDHHTLAYAFLSLCGGESNGSKLQSDGSQHTHLDRKLAHSAQMYHFQHQKQQMMAMEK